MTLVPGADLGPYRIEAPIGAGGMGAVYKARDTRLDRTVAIKTVEGRFSERFEREARTIASLNHPHICTLHDVGENYLVMEYIEGAPVSGPLPLIEVLRLGAQIADALDAAHRKGITHRDLKPGNVLVSKAGAKVIDFGLAKAGPVVRGELDVTLTKALTGEGAIVGTICYMSPEQLQGQEADARSDVFALGCVLYEMLTGKRAFDGKSPVSIMAAILEHEPAPLSEVQPMAPAWLDRVIRRCLRKDPDARWQSAADIALELREPPALSAPATPPAAAPRRWPWVAAVASLLFALLVALWAPWRVPFERPSYTLEINAPEGESLNVQSQVSPDGRSIALFLGVLGQTRALAVRDLVTGEVRRLQGAEGITNQPAWSPDSRSLAFVAGTKLKRISASGGTAQVLADFQTGMIPFLSWGSRDIILFSRTNGLHQIPASGGTPAAVTAVTAGAAHGAPQFLPDGRHFLYITQGAGVSGVFAGSVDSPPEQNRISVLPGAATVPLYARGPDGDDNLVFLRDGALMVQPFDTSSLKLTGNARLLVAPAFSTGNVLPAASLSRNGVLSYASAAPAVRSRISWFDRSGQSRGNIGSEGAWSGVALSPDGKRLAAGRDGDIWLFDLSLTDLAEAVPVRFTFSGQSRVPVWAPDGTWIVFSRGTGQGAVFRKAANLSSPEAPLPGLLGFASDWSAAGLLVQSRGDLIVSREDRVTPLLTTPANEVQGQFSPDGKWIAYTSDETGHQEIWVQSFPPTGAKWQVSTAGGAQPRWRPDGKELYYVANPGGRLIAVPVKIQPAFQYSRPVPLFDAGTTGGSGFNYVVARDGRFIINSRVPGRSAALTVNTNWFALLKK